MPRLCATYEMDLPSYLGCRNLQGDWHVPVEVNGFTIQLSIIPSPHGPSTEHINEEHTQGVKEVRIAVSREEPTEPPSLGTSGKDFSKRSEWFNPRDIAYREAALQIANRFVDFLRFRLLIPNLNYFASHDFFNPTWKNDKGDTIDSGIRSCVVVVLPEPGLRPLAARELTEDLLGDLTVALRSGLEVETFEEFLADAKSSIIQGKFRRAVLEMAIALEVLIKQTFFIAQTPAAAAIEYLEDQRRVQIRSQELLDGPAKQAFGQSLKEHDSRTFRDIDHLFRCRNRVAHRGQLSFRDDCGNDHNVDRDVLEAWWQSAETLVKWISAQRAAKNPP